MNDYFVLFLFFTAPLFAGVDAPRDPRSVYNHGASLAAAGKFDDAVTELQKTAVVRDENIAALSLALLGQITVDKVRQTLAENPIETEPDKQKECLKYLESAEKYYSESFSLQKTKAVSDALEQIRAWRSKITAEWYNADWQQKRQNEIMVRIEGIAQEQKKVNQVLESETQTQDSPRKFQICYEKAKEQRKIAEETEQIKATFDKMEEQTKNTLPLSTLPEIQRLMTEAADDLTKNQPAASFPKQQRALELLQEILKQQQNQQEQNQPPQNDKQEEQNEDNQDRQNESQPKEQEKQNQDSQNPQQQKDEEQTANEKDSEEQQRKKAEQRLRQVRRRQQEVDERRERIRTLLMQAEPVEKDW